MIDTIRLLILRKLHKEINGFAVFYLFSYVSMTMPKRRLLEGQ